MKYLGIDIAKYKHAIAGIDVFGNQLFKPRFFSQNAEGFEWLIKHISEQGDPAELTIGMEATGHYWIVLYDFLTENGWKVQVINPLLSHAVSAGNIRGRKSDKDDAHSISCVIRDGGFEPYQAGPLRRRELKQLCRQRSYLANDLANHKRRLGALLDQVFPEWRTVWKCGISKALMAVMTEWPSATELSRAHATRLQNVIKTASRKPVPPQRIKEIRKMAAQSVAKSSCPGLAGCLRSMIQLIGHLETEVKLLEADIETYHDGEIAQMQTIPGIAKVNGAVIASEIGDMSRFMGKEKKAHKLLLAYAGLDPRIRESGNWKGRTKMSKRGSRALRTALYQSADAARKFSPGFQAIYDDQKARGKHHSVAVSHVARKLVIILVAMHKSGRPFTEDCFMKTTT